jgi:hypothetical protein
MRRLLIALIALSAVAALNGSASAAAPATTTVHAKKLGVIPANLPYYETEWVAKADAGTIAWGLTVKGSRATTITDGGVVRAMSEQPGCTAMTAGAGSIGYDCGPFPDETSPFATLTTRVVPLSGGGVRDASASVPVPAAVSPGPPGSYLALFRLDGLGSRWAHFSQNCDYKYCQRQFYSQDVDWRTGAAATVKTLDPTLYENLDASALTVPLCAPLRSNMAALVRFAYSPTVIPVVVARPWALLAGDPTTGDPGDLPSWRVQRCGSSRPVTLPAGSTPVALGAGWVLLAKGSTVRLMRLADHRIVKVAGAGSLAGRQQAAITARRVVFTASGLRDGSAIYTAHLPVK